MAIVYSVLVILLVVLLIVKQHQDRQQPAKILTIVPSDRMAPPISKEVSKSWWEEIAEKLKQVGIAGLLIFVGWLAHSIASL